MCRARGCRSSPAGVDRYSGEGARGPRTRTPVTRTTTLRHAARLAVGLAAAGGALACQKQDAVAPPVPAAVFLVQGGNQSVQAGRELPNPIVLRVTDAAGLPVEKVPVGLVVATGGGAVNPASALTDASGEVRLKWQLGAGEASQSLTASSPGLEPVSVGAVGIVPSDLVVAQGNNQTARAGGVLPTSIVIRVVGAGNVPMAGVTVGFQVTAGGGVITPQSAVTSNLGEVTARWTLGATAGPQAISVTSGSLSPVAVSAIAQ